MHCYLPVANNYAIRSKEVTMLFLVSFSSISSGDMMGQWHKSNWQSLGLQFKPRQQQFGCFFHEVVNQEFIW